MLFVLTILQYSAACSYTASLQEMKEGTLRMHRKVTSDDVEDYASHVPKDEVELDKEEDIEYQKGILTRASGTVETKLMRKVCIIIMVRIKS